MRIGTVDLNKLRFVINKSSGLAKELLGVLVGNNRLQEAGQAQQQRATEEARALSNELEAQRQEAKAASFEKLQKTAQSSR